MAHRRLPTALLLAVPAVLAVAAYGRVLHGEFLFDDGRVVQRNPVRRDPALVLRGFGDALVAGGRPTPEVVFSLPRSIGGGAPWAFHAASLLLHLAAVALAFLLTREVLRLAGSRSGSGVAVAVAG